MDNRDAILRVTSVLSVVANVALLLALGGLVASDGGIRFWWILAIISLAPILSLVCAYLARSSDEAKLRNAVRIAELKKRLADLQPADVERIEVGKGSDGTQ